MITVLYVDDEPVLLDLASRFLEKTNEFKVVTALSAQEALDLLKKESIDAIVSDYMMPEMDGISLLKEIRKDSSIPFIMFTGRGSETVALEATNNGADYYVQKGADPQALFRELTYKLRLAISQHRSDNEEQLTRKTIKVLMEKADEAILISSLDGRIFDYNTKLMEIYYLTKEDLTSMKVMDLFVNPEENSEIRKQVLSGGEYIIERDARHPDGSVFPVLVSLTRIYINKSRYFLYTIKKITEPGKPYEDFSFFTFTLNVLPEGIIYAKDDGIIQYVNATLCKMLDIPLSECIGHSIIEIDPSMTTEVWNDQIKRLALQDIKIIKTLYCHKNGSMLPVQVNSIPYEDKGKNGIILFINKMSE